MTCRDMEREIRKLRDLGNGSGGITLPKEFLRDLELMDDNDELADAHIIIEKDEDDDGLSLLPFH